MTVYRVTLRFDRTLAAPPSWYWLDDLRAVRARFRLPGVAEEIHADLPVYFRGERSAGAVRLVPQFDGTFVTDVLRAREGAPRCEIVLVGTPEAVAGALIGL